MADNINMDCFVYAIKSKVRNYIYVGLSFNTKRRIKEHNDGQNKTTKPYGPFETLLIKKYPDRNKARLREKYLKSGVGKEFLKNYKK